MQVFMEFVALLMAYRWDNARRWFFFVKETMPDSLRMTFTLFMVLPLKCNNILKKQYGITNILK